MPTATSGNGPILRYGETLARPDRTNVNLGTELTPTIQSLYSIFLWNLETSEILTVGDGDVPIDPKRRTTKAEYFFEVPPKVHDMAEPFATRIISTQNGGKYIESHGSIYKDIRLSGTTGLRPRKKAPTVVPLLSTQAFEGLAETFTSTGLGNSRRTVPTEEATGFDDIHFLRNMFRRYSDSKARHERLIMVWRNIKDDDYWVVEPKSFKLVQNSQSPLTYNYQIDFQGLAKFDPNLAGVEIAVDPLAALRDASRFFSRVQEFKQNLTAAFLVVATQINRIQGAGHFLVSNTVGTLTEVIKGLTAISGNARNFASYVPNVVQKADNDWNKALEDLTAQFQGLDDDTPMTPAQQEHYDNFGTIINYMRKVLSTLNRIQVEPAFQETLSDSETSARARASGSYHSPGVGAGAPSSPRSGGDPSSIHNSRSPSHVAEARVHVGETIRNLAGRLLGDPRRWHELVLINDLRAPYTADGAARAGVLVPGDVVLYPSRDGLASSGTVTAGQQSDAETDKQDSTSAMAQVYGRDARLKSVQAGSSDLSDLCVNQRGDISTIAGIPNVRQAVLIKFSTERGTLAAHPTFGARASIGSKASIVSFNEFRINTLSTLRSDPRVANVTNLEFRTVGDVLEVSANLALRNGSDFLNTDFALRRF